MVRLIPGRKHLLRHRQQAQRKRLEQTLLRSPSRHPRFGNRRVYVNINLPSSALNRHGLPKTQFASNRIRTSKYTVLSFIPKNLFEQFRRIANVYFLFLAVLQLLPYFDVGSPVFVVLPISTVIGITAIKDGFEDYKRHVSDRRYNSSQAQTLQHWVNTNYPDHNVSIWTRVGHSISDFLLFPCIKFNLFGFTSNQSVDDDSHDIQSQKLPPAHAPNAEFACALWQDIRVGDLVYLKNNQSVPADIIILATSEEDGECYIETKELDGETNLKTRVCLDETSHMKTAKDCVDFQCFIESDPPSSHLYTYQATMHIINQNASSPNDDISKNSKLVPININNTLLRGHVLRNTGYVIGVVVFTGGDTKIMLNSGNTPSKRSCIEKTMNQQIVINFGILIVLCLICAVASGLNQSTFADTVEGAEAGTPFQAGFVTFWASLIIFQNIIPISLYVSIEFVKTWQAYFIYRDIQMYYEPTDSVCIPKSWNLSDDLGQIEYIFSDKTGTLTRNIMEFSRCSINGRSYGKSLKGETDAAKGAKVRKGIDPTESETNFDPEKLYEKFMEEMKRTYSPKYANIDPNTITFADPKIFEDMREEEDGKSDLSESQSHKIREFFMLLAVCHTVIIEKPEEGEASNQEDELKYRAESPDENALVSAAKDLGFTFLSRNKDSITIDVLGEEVTFQLLQVLEFNSTRKRMSVIIRRPKPWNDVVLFCKGADNIIFERLANDQEEMISATSDHIDEYSNEGLRTLCLGYRILTEEQYSQWEERYQQASTSLDDRDEEMEECCSEIEKELVLIGATAIEDKLQENVPECILSLRQAGMKVWVLTGDKMETAINIGFACNLLTNEMELWTIRGDDVSVAKEQFLSVVANIRGDSSTETDSSNPRTSASYYDQMPLPRRSSTFCRESMLHALVIDGSALKFILDDMDTRALLLEIAPLCRSVVCCRTSPLQKAQVVHLIRKGRNAVCLAIGDGANDVSMIQAADVGVAISGEEGLQAAMASDYTISQFKYLRNLLLVHGFWSYLRIAEMILNSFYKNVIWVVAVLWYQFYCGFSANLFYDYAWIQLYNIIFTTIPVVIIGTCDRAVGYEHALENPNLYKLGIKQSRYGMSRFWVYIIEGLYQSAICYFAFYFVYTTNVISWGGQDAGIYDLSTCVAVTLITVVSLEVGINAYSWNWMMFASVFGSILIAFLFALVYTLLTLADSYGTGLFIFQSPSFWITYLVSVVLALLPRYLVLFVKQVWFYEDLDIVREIEKFASTKAGYPGDNPSKIRLNPTRNSGSEQLEKTRSSRLTNDLISVDDLELNQMELSIRSR
ncbi:hypothetical protein K7432_003913 [Basidiobolus ranarum]|uniref:Phospholipid-transporting ATPase n=1 Tax=Basidiobolus ranarum TaxID=34480 RepID=A0ABR2W6B5_9FUNG